MVVEEAECTYLQSRCHSRAEVWLQPEQKNQCAQAQHKDALEDASEDRVDKVVANNAKATVK